MKKVLMLMILVSVAAEGCKKDAKPANTADDIAPAVSGGNSVYLHSGSGP